MDDGVLLAIDAAPGYQGDEHGADVVCISRVAWARECSPVRVFLQEPTINSDLFL